MALDCTSSIFSPSIKVPLAAWSCKLLSVARLRHSAYSLDIFPSAWPIYHLEALQDQPQDVSMVLAFSDAMLVVMSSVSSSYPFGLIPSTTLDFNRFSS